jgi:hypothetical protein
MRRLPALIATVLVGAAATPGRLAATPLPEVQQLVILLRPADIDELTREALARITGELAAARFRVVILPLEPAVDPTDQVQMAGRDLSPVAAFALVRGDDEETAGSVAIWVSDRLAQRTTIQRAIVQGGDVSRAAEVLAVEAVEIIRGSMADLWPQPRVAVSAVHANASAQSAAERAVPSVALGIGMLQDLRVTPALWAPVLKLGYGRPGGLGVRLTASGLGPGIDLPETAAGGAHLWRETAWVSLVTGFRPARRLQPSLCVGMGADHLRVQGSALDSSLAHERTAWSGLASAGADVALRMTPHVGLVLEAETIVFFPPLRIQVGDSDVARFALLSVMVDAGLRATF